MNYEYPKIDNIEQVRTAIVGRDEFIEADRGDHIIFNYLVNFENTFPQVLIKREWNKMVRPPEDWKANWPHDYDAQAAILRECRGLIFDKNSGEVIARRFHKFFNYGEKPETLTADFTRDHIILEKLDGSMITPFEVKSLGDSRSIKIGTKMGDTDVAKMHENLLITIQTTGISF